MPVDTDTTELNDRINREIAAGNEVRPVPLNLDRLERLVAIRAKLAGLIIATPRNAYLVASAERIDTLIADSLGLTA